MPRGKRLAVAGISDLLLLLLRHGLQFIRRALDLISSLIWTYAEWLSSSTVLFAGVIAVDSTHRAQSWTSEGRKLRWEDLMVQIILEIAGVLLIVIGLAFLIIESGRCCAHHASAFLTRRAAEAVTSRRKATCATP